MISHDEMEDAIKRGGTVLLGDQLYRTVDELPGQAEMAAYVKARSEAVKSGDAVPAAPPPKTKASPAVSHAEPAPEPSNGEEEKPRSNPGTRR